MSICIGIDPGQAGGIAVIDSYEPSTEVWPMPDTEQDTWSLIVELARRQGEKRAVIESVHSMPKQGVASSFKFGRNYGFLRACLHASMLPFEEVTPGVWQRALGCLSGGDKNVTKAKAQQLFPALRVTHKTADALLLCEWLRRRERGQ